MEMSEHVLHRAWRSGNERERDGAFEQYPTVVGTSHHCELVVAFC